jgi:hypothetical protein
LNTWIRILKSKYGHRPASSHSNERINTEYRSESSHLNVHIHTYPDPQPRVTDLLPSHPFALGLHVFGANPGSPLLHLTVHLLHALGDDFLPRYPVQPSLFHRSLRFFDLLNERHGLVQLLPLLGYRRKNRNINKLCTSLFLPVLEIRENLCGSGSVSLTNGSGSNSFLQ